MLLYAEGYFTLPEGRRGCARAATEPIGRGQPNGDEALQNVHKLALEREALRRKGVWFPVAVAAPEPSRAVESHAIFPDGDFHDRSGCPRAHEPLAHRARGPTSGMKEFGPIDLDDAFEDYMRKVYTVPIPEHCQLYRECRRAFIAGVTKLFSHIIGAARLPTEQAAKEFESIGNQLTQFKLRVVQEKD